MAKALLCVKKNKFLDKNLFSIVKHNTKIFFYCKHHIIVVFHLLENKDNVLNSKFTKSQVFSSYLEFSFLIEKCGLISAIINIKEFF